MLIKNFITPTYLPQVFSPHKSLSPDAGKTPLSLHRVTTKRCHIPPTYYYPTTYPRYDFKYPYLFPPLYRVIGPIVILITLGELHLPQYVNFTAQACIFLRVGLLNNFFILVLPK